MTRSRPTAWQWLRYAFGAGLPSGLEDWVLHDTTGSTWVWRHLSRSVVQIAPVLVLVVVFVPGPEWIRLVGAAAGSLMAFVFSLAYMVESNDRRLAKAGFPNGLGEGTRQLRATQGQADSARARRDRAAQRRARRQAG
jgi:hypothetical protein